MSVDEPGTHVRQHHINSQHRRSWKEASRSPAPRALSQVVEGRIGNGPWVEVATLNDDDFTPKTGRGRGFDRC